MFTANNRAIPKDPTLYILSYLDDQGLRAIAQTCKKGNELADNNNLWISLFKRTFVEDPFKKDIFSETHPKTAFMITKIQRSRYLQGFFSEYRPYDISLHFQKNVGWGNTLAYFSKKNNWETPVKLFCYGSDKWWGIFPKITEFKFVIIDSENKITWEKRVGNRHHCEKSHCYIYDRGNLEDPIEFN